MHCSNQFILHYRTVLILGIVWEPSTDLFRVKLCFDESALTTVTKRVILSIGSKVFDPIS